MNELAPKCKRCHLAITDNFISALDGHFHPGCFVCTVIYFKNNLITILISNLYFKKGMCMPICFVKFLRI